MKDNYNNNYKSDYYGVIIGIVLVVVAILAAIIGSSLRKNDAYKELTDTYDIISQESDDTYLVYDKETNIVYKAILETGYGKTTRYNIQSYFASNGLPYKYNDKSKEIEMIEQE